MSETVIEFGEPKERAGFLRGLSSDRRVRPLVAGLGGVAAFASLISEWQVTTVNGLVYGSDEVGETKMLRTDLFDLGGVGAAYVVGLFFLVIAVLLAILGPEAGRRYAKLAGFGSGGVLLALLAASIQLLGAQSRQMTSFYTLALDAGELKVALGRGLWCAIAAVVAALVALGLGGRDPEEPRPVPVAEPDEDEPLELSIAPTEPFMPTVDNRDIPLR
ncbi:hypothetical protein [Actinoplanes sp. HUAS TT8]|uniref:hypothetical protein n=1 Tax=Actinoplanes sp. HUAS TT8 TaxID=3447453 RepID=UPI003F520DA6